MDPLELEAYASAKVEVLKRFLAAQPPVDNGERVLEIWEELYDAKMASCVVETVDGPSDDEENPVFPYEKIEAVVGDGGNWKWPRMWQHLDEIERRGDAYRENEALNMDQANKNPNIAPLRVVVVGGGPVGLRMAIELAMGGHAVTVLEKRREKRSEEGGLEVLGFTNRINRPHMWNFVRNDLAKLNGKDFLLQKCQYPVFTEPETSSIGIDELQCLLLKNALLLGVDFRLGVGYKNAVVVADPETMMPRWKLDLTFDEHAKKEDLEQECDALVGCDGPRSTVRQTMTKYLGEIEKRKFQDCVGIVANVRKVSRRRLRELGFEFGQEPNDMNRTKLVFRDFFHKLNEEADADLEALIYYKAGFHNYTILTPKRANLVKHGLSGKVYHHTVARAALDGGDSKSAEKAKLKAYCKSVLKAAGVPVDDELPNDGFVDAPNDVMSFDFAECWNTRKSIAFELPPPGYKVSEDGPYRGRAPFPIVALAGDSLLEPFWPMGLGLKRGWHAIFDCCWALDNIFNPLVAQRILKQEDVTWEEHYQTMRDQMEKHLEWCKRLVVTDDLAKGAYDDKGTVMKQLRKIDKDVETPTFQVEIDPWTRYKDLEKQFADHYKYGLRGEEKDAWLHPVVRKALAKHKFYADLRKGSKHDEIVHRGKPLLEIDGKKVETVETNSSSSASKKAVFARPAGSKRHLKEEQTPPQKHALDPSEVLTKSAAKRESLVATALALDPPKPTKKKLPPGARLALPAEVLQDHAHHGPAEDGHQENADQMWTKMSGAHLTPTAEAELDHVRNMIQALTKTIQAYQRAEQQILLNGKATDRVPL
ncbi:hypothetical protein CTAYLR_004601 [Chrysophaeum taylorii]|uniref:FAD-dependent oxidoreductase 2 FAD-binding domain-containing protein n=1 Tax=Chrysophaeum taylorii TaxID=2483200 RepID=A0AAD7XLX9_9STRA|nr:hypothetical protein CTAYLR_004601 [Chrysophaeum taylorii]